MVLEKIVTGSVLFALADTLAAHELGGFRSWFCIKEVQTMSCYI